MQYLKKAWNYWMDLDISAWIDHIPDKLLAVLISVGYVLLTITMFWFSWTCLDLRHPMAGHIYSELSAWMRIPFGCAGGVCGIYLVVCAIMSGRKTLEPLWDGRKHFNGKGSGG